MNQQRPRKDFRGRRDLPPERFIELSGLQTVLKGTQIEFGKYFNRNTFLGLQTTPAFYQANPPLPGFRL